MTTVWLFEPRSHGREKEATRARNGAPLPGRLPSFRLPHRSASSALCPCGYAASFRRRAASFVRGVWCLEFGGAASGGGAVRARAVRVACRGKEPTRRVVLAAGCALKSRFWCTTQQKVRLKLVFLTPRKRPKSAFPPPLCAQNSCF